MLIAIVVGQHQGNAGHRQDPRALGARPGFAELGLERGGHDLHDCIEIDRAAGCKPHGFVRVHAAHAASTVRASGARA